jgi:hypothetical protein
MNVRPNKAAAAIAGTRNGSASKRNSQKSLEMTLKITGMAPKL